MYILFIIVKTLNRGEIMNKIIKYSMYAVALIFMFIVVVSYNTLNKEDIKTGNIPVDYDYVTDLVNSKVQQVNKINDTNIIIRPYFEQDVDIVKSYYDYKADSKVQEQSISYYDGMYVQSTGVSYASKKDFDVVSVLDGEVTEVKNDELMGNSITIKHSDNTFSVYQSIKDITVKTGDKVKQGDKIAIVGTSNMSKELGKHLYFELIIDENCVNPEEYYDNAL